MNSLPYGLQAATMEDYEYSRYYTKDLVSLVGSDFKTVALRDGVAYGLWGRDGAMGRSVLEYIYSTVEFDGLIYPEPNGFPRMSLIVGSVNEDKKTYVDRTVGLIVGGLERVVEGWDEEVRERGIKLLDLYYPTLDG